MKIYAIRLILILTPLLLLIQCKDMKEYFEVRPYTNQIGGKYPNQIFYEIFLQSFYDSNDDGIGDINGLIQKIDYLDELGVEAVWLLPVHPAMSYHKYDITDYLSINKDYGTSEDFKTLVEELHKRGIKVIIDLVVNHTGSDHKWFREAITHPESKYKNYYIWTADNEKISAEENHWHSDKDKNGINSPEKYYGFFWNEMPDLNYDNQDVRDEIISIGKFWLEEMKIDGFRLDAVRFFYPEDQNGKNYEWWREFTSEMLKANPDFFCVGEIWGEDSVIAPFLKAGINAGFNFDLSFSIINAVKTGTSTNLISNLQKTYDLYKKEQSSLTDATFLTNHDQNRLMSELGNVKYKAKLAASILLTLPGSPFIYYGEEIGMKGKKPDENIREPFLWKTDTNSLGYCKWISPVYNKTDSISSLEEQRSNPKSVFNYYKDLINLRKSSEALIYGDIIDYQTNNDSILVYGRSYENEELLVIHNLNNYTYPLDFSQFNEKFRRLIFSPSGSISKVDDKIILPMGTTLVFSNITE